VPPILSTLLPALAGFLTFFGVLLLVVGVATLLRGDPVSRRLEDVTRRVPSMDDIELQAPFAERFFKPMAAQAARLAARITPGGVQDGTQRRLQNAGLSPRMQVSDYLGIKGIATFGGIALAVLLWLLFRPGPVFTVVLVGVCVALGYYGPDLWLRDQIGKRKVQVTNALPDMVDLLTVSVEAGLGFDQALARIVSKSENVLALEFARVLQEMRVGIARRDALHSLVERTGVDDVGIFVTAIVQAEQLGASVGKVLRIQSSDMRTRRRQRAEKLAHQAPIKMLFPMAFLIFPPIFIVVLGPAVPRILKLLDPSIPL
jgi:tight adherence protein C